MSDKDRMVVDREIIPNENRMVEDRETKIPKKIIREEVTSELMVCPDCGTAYFPRVGHKCPNKN